MQTQSFNAKGGHFKVAVSGSVTRLQPIERRINLNRKQSPSILYAAAMNARCAASGQTQTLTNKAPGVTKAPQREILKLDSIVFNQMVAELLKKVLKRDVFSWNVSPTSLHAIDLVPRKALPNKGVFRILRQEKFYGNLKRCCFGVDKVVF
ncbi:hypothetical protein POTOM_006431 [Populus tomentosa]|uniref:Uncharacterized protein n=1 Tax=Populus tomentosa TaxID=118781 RepID=A0A8X8AJ47_POPTO|nr:hypothetical protein POTOM_006431 [Populus tomentosa]